MRVLQVVALLTPDGRFGGPARVAIDMSRILISRGHEVTILAGCDGYASCPTSVEGVPAVLFQVRRALPAVGFLGLASLGMLKWLNTHMDEFDVVHVHVGRDLLTGLTARLATLRRAKLFLHTHGMIGPSKNRLASVFDMVISRPVLRSAFAVWTLTEAESRYLHSIAPSSAPQVLRNGVIAGDSVSPECNGTEVLYLARLSPRKNAPMFVRACLRLASKFPAVEFRIVGPDGGDQSLVEKLILEADEPRVEYEGAVAPSATKKRISRASIYVLPAVDEPFGLTVLEAMSVGVPVVITSGCELRDLVRSEGVGIVTEPTVDGLVSGIASLLSSPRDELVEMGARGRVVVEQQFSWGAVADAIEREYAAVMGVA